MAELIQFTIKRSTWLRGGDAPSVLYREADGKMCCVGQFLLALGVPVNALRMMCYLRGVVEQFAPSLRDEAEWLHDHLPYVINDLRDIAESERESRVTDAFRKLGYEPVFVD